MKIDPGKWTVKEVLEKFREFKIALFICVELIIYIFTWTEGMEIADNNMFSHNQFLAIKVKTL